MKLFYKARDKVVKLIDVYSIILSEAEKHHFMEILTPKY